MTGVTCSILSRICDRRVHIIMKVKTAPNYIWKRFTLYAYKFQLSFNLTNQRDKMDVFITDKGIHYIYKRVLYKRTTNTRNSYLAFIER